MLCGAAEDQWGGWRQVQKDGAYWGRSSSGYQKSVVCKRKKANRSDKKECRDAKKQTGPLVVVWRMAQPWLQVVRRDEVEGQTSQAQPVTATSPYTEEYPAPDIINLALFPACSPASTNARILLYLLDIHDSRRHHLGSGP